MGGVRGTAFPSSRWAIKLLIDEHPFISGFFGLMPAFSRFATLFRVGTDEIGPIFETNRPRPGIIRRPVAYEKK